MGNQEKHQKPRVLEAGIEEMQLGKEEHFDDGQHKARVTGVKRESTSGSSSPRSVEMKSAIQSPIKPSPLSQSPAMSSEKEEKMVGGEVTVKQEPGQPPKLARSSLQKIVARPAALFHECASTTEEAKKSFQVLAECSYSSKYIGSTEHAMDCDCVEEWDNATRVNSACGEDSDCINRATKMECVGGDCGCGPECQNQRFQRQEYAAVTVFKTDKKGYGLRADTDLNAHAFIYEYIGEVINEVQFRRRMIQYDEEGIKHFYFMSLSKGEFVDATKKGNLGRFCNHSCNPNCYVDKWVVGDKLRMGIFAERQIKAGEELVFNYNVDRYGANPQPCYCGEPNCTGFIGGKTQTERATKLSNATIEALGIDDSDGWDTAKKPRKKKVGEDDEEYVDSVQPKSLDEDGVTKVMATLMQSKEKWIAVKLLGRIQRCDDERVRNRVVKMHGYQILNSTLALWKEDFNVVLQVLDVLDKFPRLTRNKIIDSKIESTVGSLQDCGDDRVEAQTSRLLAEWSTLEVAYRIPRKKRDINSIVSPDKSDRFARRDSGREERKGRSRSRSPSRRRSRSPSLDAPRGPAAPGGPRSSVPQRVGPFYQGPRPPFRPRPFNALPSGWFTASSNGKTYYYNATGETTWTRPTQPVAPPAPPPKPVSTNKALEDIINEIANAKSNTPKERTPAATTNAPKQAELKKPKESGKERWRSYDEEKQKKVYENTLSKPIIHVMGKFKGKLPKDDLKRFAKEISKKVVNSDYKNHRVEDPTRISARQEKQVKKFVRDYFEKAVAKKREHEKKKAERRAKDGKSVVSPSPTPAMEETKEGGSDDGEGMDMSDDDVPTSKHEGTTPATPLGSVVNGDVLKRKREMDDDPSIVYAEDGTPCKRFKSESPPPAPPPPPPADGLTPDDQSPLELPYNDGQVVEGDD